MKRFLSNMLLIFIFSLGLAIVLYPTVSDMMNRRHQSAAIAEYEQAVVALDTVACKQMLEAAQAYNQKLLNGTIPQSIEDTTGNAEYLAALDPNQTGIIGSVQIDSIQVRLPIYHGVSTAVLQAGAGHLPATSLPVGGLGTHAVLSGHTGLPSAKLFTDLDQLRIGDVFTIDVLDQNLAYEVDQILTVEPDDVSALWIDPNQDHVTLVTCTPYGINSHRLLVRGIRVPYQQMVVDGHMVRADAVSVDEAIVIPAVSVPVLLVYLLILLRRQKRRRLAEQTKEVRNGKKT